MILEVLLEVKKIKFILKHAFQGLKFKENLISVKFCYFEDEECDPELNMLSAIKIVGNNFEILPIFLATIDNGLIRFNLHIEEDSTSTIILYRYDRDKTLIDLPCLDQEIRLKSVRDVLLIIHNFLISEHQDYQKLEKELKSHY